MRLWSGTLSPFSLKVRIYMREKGLDFEIAEVPWSRQRLWGPKPRAFLDASPRGEVPALEDGNLRLFDSTLIWQYLEEAHPSPPLLPESPVDRAVCRMWEDQADHALAAQVTTLIREGFMKPDGSGDQEALATATGWFSGYYDVLDRRLQATPFLCESYSIADIASFACVVFAQTLGAAPGETHGAVSEWYQRVSERAVVADELSGLMAAAAAV